VGELRRASSERIRWESEFFISSRSRMQEDAAMRARLAVGLERRPDISSWWPDSLESPEATKYERFGLARRASESFLEVEPSMI
jgi:hypothetical protein